MKLKKISALLLALVMVIGTMSIAVFAEETGTESGGYRNYCNCSGW